MKITFIKVCFAGFIFLNPYIAADANFPEWLKGKPDTQVYKNRQKIYQYVFDDISIKTAVSLNIEVVARESTLRRLARERVINTTNKAVSHWQLHRSPSYIVRLRYLLTGQEDPVHYDFNLSDNVLKKHIR